jgi:hypothetical protein
LQKCHINNMYNTLRSLSALKNRRPSLMQICGICYNSIFLNENSAANFKTVRIQESAKSRYIVKEPVLSANFKIVGRIWGKRREFGRMRPKTLTLNRNTVTGIIIIFKGVKFYDRPNLLLLFTKPVLFTGFNICGRCWGKIGEFGRIRP